MSDLADLPKEKQSTAETASDRRDLALTASPSVSLHLSESLLYMYARPGRVVWVRSKFPAPTQAKRKWEG